ncbi:MAG: SpoIIE family protein phosphatase [Thermoleophilaceae bacterium]
MERARVEDRPHDSEAGFRELADTVPALMWMADPEGRLTFVNQGWLRFTGGSPEEELGERLGLSAHPDDRAALLERWHRALAARVELRAEYRLRRHDGEYRWVLEVGIPRAGADGQLLGYVGTVTDIHERKLMEEGLRESEQGFRELADTAPVMIWTTNPEGNVTFVNQGWLRFTGSSLAEELGASWTRGVHPDDADEVLSSWLAALDEHSVWEREYRLRRHDDRYRWIVDRGVPRFEGGRFAGYIGTATDIHERKVMEQRLREVYEREHRIAETLQRSLLPERLPEIEDVTLAARYLPAGRDTAVGGDWYDALELPGGKVALVVGDVVGHGLRAAAAMGQLRNACRAYALVESSPASVLTRINMLLARGGEDTMATMIFIVLDRTTGEVVWSCAGHPPALLLEPQGARFLEGGRSVPLGATDSATFREGTAQLAEEATLLLYTDGLVERRDIGLDDRLAQLSAAARTTGGELEQVCDQVLAGVLGDSQPADDVALLAVRPEPANVGNVRLVLPAEPGSLPRLRRRLTRFLSAAGADEAEAYEIILTVCEAAGNAIEHAYGPGDETFAVEVGLEEGAVIAVVRDTGSWRESRDDRRDEYRGRGLTIMEGLADEVEVLREARGTTVRIRRRLGDGVAA